MKMELRSKNRGFRAKNMAGLGWRSFVVEGDTLKGWTTCALYWVWAGRENGGPENWNRRERREQRRVELGGGTWGVMQGLPSGANARKGEIGLLIRKESRGGGQRQLPAVDGTRFISSLEFRMKNETKRGLENRTVDDGNRRWMSLDDGKNFFLENLSAFDYLTSLRALPKLRPLSL
jgi:hypothetical protein